MAVSRARYFHWSKSGLPRNAPPYDDDAPALVALRDYLLEHAGGCSEGINDNRKMKGKGKANWSVHCWAAFDWRWGYHKDREGRAQTWLNRDQALEWIDWLVDNSEELSIQHIMDEGRSWMSHRSGNAQGGWQPYNSGYSGWLHIEVGPEGRGDGRPVEEKIEKGAPQAAPTAPAAPEPEPEPEEDDMSGPFCITLQGKTPAGEDWLSHIEFVVDGGHTRWIKNGHTAQILRELGWPRQEMGPDKHEMFAGLLTDFPPVGDNPFTEHGYESQLLDAAWKGG